MKEKIAVRIEEVKTWGELVESLNRMEDVARSDMERYAAELKEEYPKGGKETESDWRYREIQTIKTRLAAYESIRTVILKAMG